MGRMRKMGGIGRRLIIAGMLLLFIGLLVHGVRSGDAGYVLSNAQTFCYRCSLGLPDE